MFALSDQTPPKPTRERRLQARDRVVIQSKVYIGPFGERAVCVIRDWTKDGARIKLLASYPTDAPSIDVDIVGERRTARVIWRCGQEIGVAFTMAPDPVDPQIAALQETLRQLRGL